MKLDTIGVQFFERLTLSHRPQVLLGPSWAPSGPGKRQLYMGCQDGGVVIGPGNGDGLETPPLILLPHASPLRVILGRLLHQMIVSTAFLLKNNKSTIRLVPWHNPDFLYILPLIHHHLVAAPSVAAPSRCTCFPA